MKLTKEFFVPRAREELARVLDRDETFELLFKGTRVLKQEGPLRETATPYTGPGQARDIRFVFETLPDGNVHFEKICDGNIWRSLEGEVQLESAGANGTRVLLRMEGRTRALVPEIAIRMPMRDQIDQMSESLRSRLSG